MCFPIKIFMYLIWGFMYHFQQIYTIICYILNIFPWPVSILYKHHLKLMHNISSYNHLISCLTIPWCCHQIFAVFKCYIEHLSWFSWSERRLHVPPYLSDKWRIKSISPPNRPSLSIFQCSHKHSLCDPHPYQYTFLPFGAICPWLWFT